MDRNELYKLLCEHYKLSPETDFWLHGPSKSWIMKHNGVKKMASQPTIQGYTIQTPTLKDIVFLKDGDEGLFGKEVVMAGDFTLKDSDGKIIRTIFRTGEANERNCKMASPWAMAEKRLYDRGVLDLLSFAELNIYSEIEADDFSRSNGSNISKPSEKTPTKPKPTITAKPVQGPPVSTWRPDPPKPAPPRPAPPKPAPVEVGEKKNIILDTSKSILEFLERNEGEKFSRGDICKEINMNTSDFLVPITKLIVENKVIRCGEKRGTKYHLVSKEAEMTKQEYQSLFREVSENLKKKGIDYSQLMNIVNQVTGHTSAISAFNAGTLKKEDIAEIENLGTRLMTSSI